MGFSVIESIAFRDLLLKFSFDMYVSVATHNLLHLSWDGKNILNILGGRQGNGCEDTALYNQVNIAI